VISKGTNPLFITKHMTTIVAAMHPMSATHAQVQTLKRNMVTSMLDNAESKLRSNRLAIHGKVYVGHSFEAYHLAKWLAKQHSGQRSDHQTPLFLSLDICLEGDETNTEEARTFLEQLYNYIPPVALPIYEPPPTLPNPLNLPLSPLPLVFFPLGGLAPTKLQLAQCSLRLQLCYAPLATIRPLRWMGLQ
jgi:hypothetical protein